MANSESQRIARYQMNMVMTQGGSGRLCGLLFDEDQSKVDLCETEALGRLHLLGPKDSVLRIVKPS